MKKILFGLLIISFSMLAKAQCDSTWKFKRKNDINFEILGSNVLYSINYERLIINKSKIKSFTSLGFSYAPYQFFMHMSDLQFLINLNQLYSLSRKSHFEAGIGMKLYKDYSSEKINLPTSVIFHLGYRFQQPNGKFYFKLLAAGSIYKMELAIYPSSGPSYYPSFIPCIGMGYAF